VKASGKGAIIWDLLGSRPLTTLDSLSSIASGGAPPSSNGGTTMPNRPIHSDLQALLAIAAAAVLAATTAAASVTLESLHREVSTFGVLDVAGTADDAFEVNEIAFDFAGPFDDSRMTALEAQQSSISSRASQVSNVVPESFVLDGEFESAGVLGPGGLLAEGFGVSLAMVRFRLDAPGELRLTGTLEASGNGVTSLRLDAASGATVFERQALRTTLEIDATVPLGVGVWTVHVQAGGYGRADASGSTPSAGRFAAVADFGIAADAGTNGLDRGIACTPNPMRHESVIRCGLGITRGTELVVHDVAGRRVRRLGPVNHAPVRWDACDDRGVRVPAGMYLVRAGSVTSGRVIVTR
jgi:hypothetical protein